MIKAISFDFYGVMYSNFDWGVINDRVYSDEKKLTEFRQLVKAANDGVIGNDRFRNRVVELAEDDKYPGSEAVHIMPIINSALMEYVQGLRKQQPNLKLAILSNGGKEHIGGVLEEFGVYDQFDLIATSAELPCYKPEPAAFEYVAQHLGVDKLELLHVDDSPRHIAGAKEAGVQALLYTDLASLKKQIENLT